jgi:hypothetical protein
MLKPASFYRLDWRSEFKKLDPYLSGKSGILCLEYKSAEAAAEKFNHLLKEDFAEKSGNAAWTSIRIDHDWYTTRKAQGIVEEFARLLAAEGFPAVGTGAGASLSFLSDNDVRGNMTVTLTDVIVQPNSSWTADEFSGRLDAVCLALQNYLQSGGHFMIVVNDAPLVDQSEFWQRIWNAGLADAARGSVLLVMHAGPQARRQRHVDSPEPNLTLSLPDSLEADESRQDDIYDDLFSIFEREGFKEPAEAASLYLSNNKTSVRLMNMKLSTAIMDVKRRNT